MVRIGIVGIGFMGRIHYLASQRLTGAKVTAVCSRDPAKLAGDWRNTRGNFGPEPGKVDLTGVKTYARFDDLLADPDIDLIDVCAVTDQHAAMATAALKAGKHVLVEKAISLTPQDADAMLAAARSAGKLLMVAHVLPFFPEFKFAAEAVRGGQYGKVVAAHFKRVIARPDWSADIADAAKTGGPAVTCSSGAVCMGGRPFVHGYEIYLEKATLVYDSGGTPLTLLTADGKSSTPALPGGGDPLAAFTDEVQAAVSGVTSGREPDLLGGQLARDALVLCHREIESVKTGRAIDVK